MVRTGTTNVSFSPGFVGLGSVGWALGNGLRMEVEPSYRTNAVSGISGLFASPKLSSGGTEQKLGLMFNAAYDFHDVAPRVVPYVGAGVGYAWANWDGVNVTALSGAKANIRNTKGAFAYQAIVGAAFPMAANSGVATRARWPLIYVLQRARASTGISLRPPGLCRVTP